MSFAALVYLLLFILRLFANADSAGFVLPSAINASDADQLKQHLLSICPYLSSGERPVATYSDTVNITAGFSFIKFLGIDDTKETISLIGYMSLNWLYPCSAWELTSEELSNGNLNATVQHLALEIAPSYQSRRWWPRFINTNNAVDINILDVLIAKANALNLYPDGSSSVYAIGEFVAFCDGFGNRLVKYPFDTQICTLRFESFWYNTEYDIVNITNDGFMTGNFTSDADVWKLAQDPLYEFGVATDSSGNYSIMSATVVLARKWNTVVYGTFLPCLALLVLQLTAFFMPPQLPERSLFSVTIILAFFIVQQNVKESIPTTSQTLLVTIYILGQMSFGAILTVYFSMMCHFACQRRDRLAEQRRRQQQHEIPLKKPLIDPNRMVDIIVGVVATTTMVVFTIAILLAMIIF